MVKHLKKSTFSGNHQIDICGSKSESNRILILKKLYKKIGVTNLSTSDDTFVLQKALSRENEVIDIHHAGTAMRFLTAYYSCFTKIPVTLTGSKRMQERPISLLVKALQDLGAKIQYVNKEGYPPLKIFPSDIKNSKVSLQANVSSQYISALMLIAPKLKNGLEIKLASKITSLPYLKMTEKLMKDLGFQLKFENNTINIQHKSSLDSQVFNVESDWSSASYFYSLVALNPKLILELKTYKKQSLQGDIALSELYEQLGVETTFRDDSILLENTKNIKKSLYHRNLNHNPDLAQTIAVTCLGLGIPCKLEGLHTLKIKETDRLVALKNEIEKFGAEVKINDNSLIMTPTLNIKSDQTIETYNDHRMAMAFAPLCSSTSLNIENPEVVSKSYPVFWSDLNKILD